MITKLENNGSPNDDFPYRSLVGSLMYLSVGTRTDISFAIKELRRYLENPCESSVTAAKHVVRYLKGSTDLGLVYHGSNNAWGNIVGFSDADFAGETVGRKSTTGIIIKINDRKIFWKSVTQSIVSQSTAEAEYNALWTQSKK